MTSTTSLSGPTSGPSGAGSGRGSCAPSGLGCSARRGRWPAWRRDRAAARSREHVMGLPGLSPKDSLKVLIGNSLMQFAASILQLCLQMRIPVVLENPHSSRVWQAPPIARLLNHALARQTVADFCQYGVPWRKRTRFLSFWVDLAPVGALCKACNGVCSRTGIPHVELSGKASPAPGQAKEFRTKIAEPYPRPLCNALCKCFRQALVYKTSQTIMPKFLQTSW